jgi:hypothetical protein
MTTTRTSRRSRTLAGTALVAGLLLTACQPTSSGQDEARAATSPDATAPSTTAASGDVALEEVVVQFEGLGDLPQPPKPVPVPLDEGGAELDDETQNTDEEFEVHLNPLIAHGPQVMVAPGMHPGCSTQCISKALVTSVATSADVDLEVITTTPAKLQVAVGTSSPVILGEQWALLNPSVVEGNDAFATTWTTRLGPLDPSTTYHILVRAEDGSGRRAWRLGSFTTTAGGPGGGFTNDPSLAGCGLQCITKAWATNVAGSADLDIEVATSRPASIEVFASTAPPSHTQLPSGKVLPSYPTSDRKASTNGQLATSLTARMGGLAQDADHHILVLATDAQGRRSFRMGQIRTGHDTRDVQITFHEVKVDHQPHERIELMAGVRGSEGSHVFPHDDTSAGSFEVGAGSVVSFTGLQYVVLGASSVYHPYVAVTGYGRNSGGVFDCAPRLGISDQPWGYLSAADPCDTRWSTAMPGIGASYDSLADCAPFGVAGTQPGDRCVRIDTGNNQPGNGYPRFSFVVSFRFLD